MLIALKIVLERLMSYLMPNTRYSFSFIAVAFAAALLGVPYAMAVAGIGDFLGAILFPIGAYFPGFTGTAILTALCTALFIYKNATLPKIIASVVINTLVGTLFLNVLWLTIFNSTSFLVLFTATAMIVVPCMALLIYKNANLPKVIASILIITLVGMLLFNVLWLTILNLTTFLALSTARIPQAIIMAAVQIVTLSLLLHKKSRVRTTMESAIAKLH